MTTFFPTVSVDVTKCGPPKEGVLECNTKDSIPVLQFPDGDYKHPHLYCCPSKEISYNNNILSLIYPGPTSDLLTLQTLFHQQIK